MKKFSVLLLLAGLMIFQVSCKDDEAEDPVVDAGTSTTELLVAKFTAAPALDAEIDDMWASAQTLTGTAEVPDLAARGTFLNSDGAGVEETLGLFEPYAGESYDYTLRSGYFGDDIYFLMEWDDMDDSKDRESWYFDATDKLWKQQHKYANDANDKYYEDKFAFLFPINAVSGFSASTCYATCHQNLTIAKDKDKNVRHYTKNDGEKIDMWHWKRVRGAFIGQVDDQKMVYADPADQSSANGRKGDEAGTAGYANNKQTLNNGTDDVSVPKYIIPGKTNYYWITSDDVTDGTAKEITAVDGNGVLTYSGGTVDPATGGFEDGTGNMRLPSVVISEFTGARGDISIQARYTGTGWVTEFTRKMNTGDPDDVVFDVNTDLDFGLAIFNNAAIAHGIKPNLKMTYVK
ncbi:MAG: hypothetical protein HKP14_00155 [Bacteroidia bacterium]|nr:hypothetical protein [Bacteroidia bacterium]